MDLIKLLVTSILLGLLCSIPGLALNTILMRKGLIRDSKVFIVFGCILGMLACQAFFPPVPAWLAMILIGFASPSGAFRNDLWLTSRRGRWWWKDKNKDL